MAACMAVTVLSRSSTTCEIDTFITVPSSTMTNWAAPKIRTTNHFFICVLDSQVPGDEGRRPLIQYPRRATAHLLKLTAGHTGVRIFRGRLPVHELTVNYSFVTPTT